MINDYYYILYWNNSDFVTAITKISLTDVNNQIDVKSILKETKYGESGIGGIITKGTMYIG